MVYCIAYTIVDKTGCRAPFWRQLKGDIAYIEVRLHDSADVVYITASTHGYFVNGVSISLFLFHFQNILCLGPINHRSVLECID